MSSIVAFAATDGDPAPYVDPFIGTGGHGHTFPGPCVPFRMMQLSPDTGTEGWDRCSGYHASDSSIMGFSHTHLSGTGAADLGDTVVMAHTRGYRTVPGTKERPDSGYCSVFSYAVGRDRIRGLRRSKGWAPDHSVCFYAQFSKPFDEIATVVNNRIVVGRSKAKGANVKVIVRFRTDADETVSVKVGLSAVSAENAPANLNAGIPDRNFDGVRARARAAWSDELGKVSVEGGIRGLRPYRSFGYIPYDKENNSVSITLEYAYDDWCIAQVAKRLGYPSDEEAYTKRALFYGNLFDTQTCFVRGKSSSGKWRPDFNPMSVSILGKGDFAEGNAWQSSFFVPQDASGLIALYGGDEKFAGKLDDLFNQPSVNDNAQSPDVTGLIGQYAHGNEPSHQVAYLYAYAGKPYKTQERVRDIMSTLYADTRDGLCGNEDCGQMSAWYVLSALGFSPVNPADGTYVVGSPLFDRAAITLPNGRAFVIKANGVSDTNRYIQSATLNGKPHRSSFITYRDVIYGGELVFIMGKKPSAWGCAADARPVSAIRQADHQVLRMGCASVLKMALSKSSVSGGAKSR